ncbi:hypothetical protein [uncultured phage MedDCM-OCT-S12-C97]|nr:hypothetical protein [uncultured phage MedDCM-OCT-S12-C97]
MSQLKVNSIVPVGGLPSGATAGGIIQTVQTVKTDTTSYSSASVFADISGISVTITPTTNSAKVLIIPDLALGGGDMANYHLVWRLLRGSTAVGVSTSATSAELTGTGGMHRGANGGNAYFLAVQKYLLIALQQLQLQLINVNGQP